MTTLKTSTAQLVAAARAQIEEVETDDLIAGLEDSDLIVVDIRDVHERHETGGIPGAYHAPRGMLEFWVDPESPHFKPFFGQAGKRYVFHCASGGRSALAVKALQDMGFACAHLKNGFTDWLEKGGDVEFPPDRRSP